MCNSPYDDAKMSKHVGVYIMHCCDVYCCDINPLTPNDPYMGRTAPLTSKLHFIYLFDKYSTEYFKHGIYSPFFLSLQNAVCVIIVTYLVPVLFTFYIQGVLKLKKNNSGAKRLIVQWFVIIKILVLLFIFFRIDVLDVNQVVIVCTT